ncbi:MAG: HAMP domain-containing protein [Candidatus Rokubacteria bacterium]|nr:HAMP domain-containing protein [Candidatus Rokubacteria bacterium]
MRPRLSVRSKLILSSLLLLVTVSFAFTAASLHLSERWVETDLRRRAITFAREVAATIGDRREFENTRLLDLEIERIREARANVQNIDFLAFGGPWVRLLASSDPAWRPPLTLHQVRELERGRVVAQLVAKPEGRSWEVVAPILLEGAVAGAVAVEFSLVEADRLAAQIRWTALGITGASILVVVLLMGLVVHRVVDRPIRQFLRAIERAERGDLSTGVALSRNDEFGRLANHFNQMLELLAQASEELEERVRQATAELAERYAEVRRLNELLFQAQRRLRHAERLALMGRTVGMIAHEVGTPIHSIAGHLELLRQELPPEVLQGAPERRLAIVRSQLLRVGETIEQLQDLTRRPAGEHTAVGLNSLLSEVLDLVSPGVAAARVSVETDLARDLPPVAGDPQQLQQAFLNVIVNALDAMPAGGHLRVATRPERRDGRQWAQVRISDTGPGIRPDHLKQIFDPFFTTKELGKGVGLGLFITQQMVREHDGAIEVESSGGQGTTFVLAFPGVEAAG